MKTISKNIIPVFLCCLLFASSLLLAQELPYKMAVSAKLGPPHPLANKGFRRTFVGAYTAGVQVEFHLLKNFFVAPSYTNTGFRIPPKKIADRLKTVLHLNNAGLMLGYGSYFSEVGYWTIAFGGGANYSRYLNIQCKDSLKATPRPRFNSSYLQTEAALNFFSEDNFSIGLFASYVLLLTPYDPSAACINEYLAFPAGELQKNTQYVDVGFVLRFMFLKKK